MVTPAHHTVLGRTVRPAALALTIANLALFYGYAANRGGALSESGMLNATAFLAGGTALLLVTGWAINKHRLIELGYMLSTAGWASMVYLYSIKFGFWSTSTLLAVAWLVLSLCSWAVERWHRALREEDNHCG